MASSCSSLVLQARCDEPSALINQFSFSLTIYFSFFLHDQAQSDPLTTSDVDHFRFVRTVGAPTILVQQPQQPQPRIIQQRAVRVSLSRRSKNLQISLNVGEVFSMKISTHEMNSFLLKRNCLFQSVLSTLTPQPPASIQTQQQKQAPQQQPAQPQQPPQPRSQAGGQPQRRALTLTREQMVEAQEMFRTANRVTRPEKALILGFMAGSRDNPCPHLGREKLRFCASFVLFFLLFK